MASWEISSKKGHLYSFIISGVTIFCYVLYLRHRLLAFPSGGRVLYLQLGVLLGVTYQESRVKQGLLQGAMVCLRGFI